MNLNTKYDLGDLVEIDSVQWDLKGRGIVDSIVVQLNDKNILCYMYSTDHCDDFFVKTK